MGKVETDEQRVQRVTITAKDNGQAAPDSIVEMEIWDASGKTVYKQHQADANFAAGQTNSYVFSWTPDKMGQYTVNVGAYGPGWCRAMPGS